MKILFIDKQEKSTAGMGTYSKTVIQILTKKGHQVMPLRYGDRLSAEDPDNTVLLPYIAGGKSSYFIPGKNTIPTVKKTIEQYHPDIIHLSLALSPLDFYIPKIAHDYRIPIVGLFHAGFPSTPPGSLRTSPPNLNKGDLINLGVKSVFVSYLPCLKQLDKVIVFSENVGEFLIKRGIDQDKIIVIPNSIDPRIYTPSGSNFKKKNKIQFAYLFLGRLDRQKNPDLLIESFLNLNFNFQLSNFKLILVGSGTIGSLGKDLVSKYQNHPNIIFTGSITDPKEKIDIIRAADVFVQPSSFEGMSFSLLETMSCGLAPVTTDAGNHAEVINNSGILLDHRKIEEQLPIAFQIFQKNPKLAKELGKRARKIIQERYDIHRNIDKLIKIYQEITKKQNTED